MTVVYPVLISEIARRGIKKNTIAKHICISERALYNKLSGNVSFTWDEAIAIKDCFFPDMDPQQLFARAEEKAACSERDCKRLEKVLAENFDDSDSSITIKAGSDINSDR